MDKTELDHIINSSINRALTPEEHTLLWSRIKALRDLADELENAEAYGGEWDANQSTADRIREILGN
jgi:hypothetical protein